MQGQINLFEWLSSQEKTGLDAISEPEMVEQIGAALGVEFKKDRLGDYRAKIGKTILSIQYDNYWPGINDGARFISTGIDRPKEGAGSPCDSIEEAIAWLKNQLERYEKNGKRGAA